MGKHQNISPFVKNLQKCEYIYQRILERKYQPIRMKVIQDAYSAEVNQLHNFVVCWSKFVNLQLRY